MREIGSGAGEPPGRCQSWWGMAGWHSQGPPVLVPVLTDKDGLIAELQIDDCCQLVACLARQGREADSMPGPFKGFLPQDMIYC